MSLRLVQLSIPGARESRVREVVGSDSVVGSWSHSLDGDRVLFTILAEAKDCESILDRLGPELTGVEHRAVLLPVEATLPKLPADEGEKEAKPDRIGRDELLQDLAEGLHPGARFFVTVLLSSIVAAIGLLRNDLAIIIGAMVIAPLLSPNVALALGTTLGDLHMVRRALGTNVSGLAVAIGFSWMLAKWVPLDVGIPAIESRTVVSLGDIGLALASGAAGALAFTSGLPASLVGVMVAVALLPPTVVTGLLLGAGHSELATGSALLLATNVICVNLSAVVTFWIQGLRPRTWWEAEQASRAMRIAVLLWGFLLALLTALIALGT